MKTIEETYREKLKILANEFGGQNELSKVIGKSAAQISQWINASPDSKTGKPRSLKSETARKIERLTGKPHAWFDQPSETLPPPPEDTETIRIDHLDMAGACGDGIEADDWPSPISSVEFPLNAVRRLFSGRDTSGLKIVGTRGDSMEPTIPETSVILIDTKTDTFAGDGIYFFAYAGGLYTKRLQKTPAGLLALSDNPLYQSFPIDENDRFRIIGRYYGVISIKLAQ